MNIRLSWCATSPLPVLLNPAEFPSQAVVMRSSGGPCMLEFELEQLISLSSLAVVCSARLIEFHANGIYVATLKSSDQVAHPEKAASLNVFEYHEPLKLRNALLKFIPARDEPDSVELLVVGLEGQSESTLRFAQLGLGEEMAQLAPQLLDMLSNVAAPPQMDKIAAMFGVAAPVVTAAPARIEQNEQERKIEEIVNRALNSALTTFEKKLDTRFAQMQAQIDALNHTEPH
jgi:hypothetical protein